MLVSARAGAAEHDWPAKPRPKPDQERLSFSVSQRSGLVEAPFVTSAFPEVSGFATVVTASAALRIPPIGWLRLRLPVSLVRLDLPATAQVSETALGNLELGLEHRLALRSSTTYLSLIGALVAPSAQHGSTASLFDNRALALGSALSAGKDAALLTPGMTGLRLRSSVERSLYPLQLRAGLEVAVLVRLSDAHLPEETVTHRVAILPVLDLAAAFWPTSWFAASLGLGLVAEPLRAQEPARQASRDRRTQPFLQPAVQARIGRHVALGLEAIVPVAGTLGGDAWSVGTFVRLGL
jgi:hypothetical protein